MGKSPGRQSRHAERTVTPGSGRHLAAEELAAEELEVIARSLTGEFDRGRVDFVVGIGDEPASWTCRGCGFAGCN
jgi:hypothetical protein